MTLHPYAVVMQGRLEQGLKVSLDEHGAIYEIAAHDGPADPFVLSAAFVNAHSHLEYRGLLGTLPKVPYFEWIKEIAEAKAAQRPESVREDCLIAALENRKTGVGYIAEHSDRPFAGEAMSAYSLDGRIFQEVITFYQHTDPSEKLATIAESLRRNVEAGGFETVMNPHSAWTVDPLTLSKITAMGDPASIHVAESVHENEYFKSGRGPIAEICRSVGLEHPVGASVVSYLDSVGLVRNGVQFVHACDVNSHDISVMAQGGVSVAHCPRSNEALDCPRAPVREMLDAGILVGLGMDSAASSGKIDLFDEMRAALTVAEARGAPLTPEEVWRMATTMGAASVFAFDQWDIEVGAIVPLIKVRVDDATTVRDLIEVGDPRRVEWVTTDVRN